MVNTDTIQLTGTYLHNEIPGMGTKGRSLSRMRLAQSNGVAIHLGQRGLGEAE